MKDYEKELKDLIIEIQDSTFEQTVLDLGKVINGAIINCRNAAGGTFPHVIEEVMGTYRVILGKLISRIKINKKRNK